MKTFGPKSTTQNLIVESQGITADNSAFTGKPVVVGGVDPSNLAQNIAVTVDGYVQTTLMSSTELQAILAKIISAPATAAAQATIQALLGGARNAVTPDYTTVVQHLLELARDGSMRVNADCYDWSHQWHLVASTAAQRVAFVRTVPTYAFDGLWTDIDGVVVFGQPRGRAYVIPDGLTFATPASWTTAGTDWSIAGNKATHAASAGGTDTLVPVALGSPLIVGKTYVVYCKVVHRGGTGVTFYCGTAAGTQVTATGEFVQALVCTGSSSASIVATTDWDGDVTAYQIYTRTPKLSAKCYNPFALSEIVGVAAGTAMTTLIVGTACDVHGVYRRVPGVTDIA